MNISAPAIERPVATTLLTLALLLAGALAYTQLPVAPLPQIDFPVISVGASLPGASPETMASAVATPLERQFGRIAGINQMTSSSQLGSTGITMQFDLNRNIDAAARDVQAAINAARGYLPADLPSNPTYRKINPADSPVIILEMTSQAMTQDQMYDVADSIMGQKLSQVEGVGQVFVWGSSQPAVRIEANPQALNQMNLGLEAVRNAIAAQNANQAKGALDDGQKTWVIRANDQLMKAKDYKGLVVAYRNGAPVRLSDVATVEDSYSNVNNAGSFNGKPSVLIVIFRQPGANIIATADRVIAALPFLKASLPPAIDLEIGLDRTTTVRASVADVQRTLIISVVLVVLVVFVFLREIRATLIPSVAVPLAIVGTFGVMYLCGYSLNNLSLMALTISTGFVVDDAIVVLENVMRHVEGGMQPYQAALVGAREIGFTVVSMSTSLIAVFIPILLMGGIVGRLFHEFAVTLSAAIAVSLVVSLTTTPMLCARFLKPHDSGSHGRLYRMSERGFYHLTHGYKVSLGWVLRHRRLILAVAIIMVFVNIALYVIVPKGFFPQQDTGRLGGMVMGDQDLSFEAMKVKTDEFIRIVKQDPGVESVLAFVGGNGAQNQGRMFVVLKPLAQRKISADEVIARLRPKTSHIPGATLFLQSVQDLQIGGRMSNAQYQYTLSGEDLDELYEWAPKLLAQLRKIPQLKDINSDQQISGLEENVVIDRATAARLGVTPQEIDAVLYDAFGQEEISTIYQTLNQYHVVMEVAPQYQRTPDALNSVYVITQNGAQVPLSTFAHFEPSTTSLSVNHQGQFPAVTLSFNLAPGGDLGTATRAIDQAEAEMRMPNSIHGSFQGTAAAFQDSLSSEPMLILAALVAVYIVLGMLYESYIHPITILSTLPSAGTGAILALMLFHMQLDVIGLIGIILLIGIVKKNAIMMIDFALEVERTGKNAEEAIYEAGLIRFRPIMMTTAAAMLGALPLAIGQGVGGEIRRPLGIAIVGGLVVSQALTLYTTPVVYLYMDKAKDWVVNHMPWRKKTAKREEEVPVFAD
ncbi:MAG TPA: multidrug efflux RND transporter permease subunit [Verrucomicrobiae bacterium]|jgi:multidrug efflux pump|nr:multidrug efflux RND transporter permease subunit [Verrucomicrobiae bacterium]